MLATYVTGLPPFHPSTRANLCPQPLSAKFQYLGKPATSCGCSRKAGERALVCDRDARACIGHGRGGRGYGTGKPVEQASPSELRSGAGLLIEQAVTCRGLSAIPKRHRPGVAWQNQKRELSVNRVSRLGHAQRCGGEYSPGEVRAASQCTRAAVTLVRRIDLPSRFPTPSGVASRSPGYVSTWGNAYKLPGQKYRMPRGYAAVRLAAAKVPLKMRHACQSVALRRRGAVAARPNAHCATSLLFMGVLALTLGVHSENAPALYRTQPGAGSESGVLQRVLQWFSPNEVASIGFGVVCALPVSLPSLVPAMLGGPNAGPMPLIHPHCAAVGHWIATTRSDAVATADDTRLTKLPFMIPALGKPWKAQDPLSSGELAETRYHPAATSENSDDTPGKVRSTLDRGLIECSSSQLCATNGKRLAENGTPAQGNSSPAHASAGLDVHRWSPTFLILLSPTLIGVLGVVFWL